MNFPDKYPPVGHFCQLSYYEPNAIHFYILIVTLSVNFNIFLCYYCCSFHGLISLKVYSVLYNIVLLYNTMYHIILLCGRSETPSRSPLATIPALSLTVLIRYPKRPKLVGYSLSGYVKSGSRFFSV